MNSSDWSLPEAAGASGLRRPATVKRSQSAAASLGQIAFPRAKPPLPPRRGIDYDFNGNNEPYRSASRVMPGEATAGSVVRATASQLSYATAATMPSNAIATDKYVALVSAARFTLRPPASRSVIAWSGEIRPPTDRAVPTEAPSKQTRRPTRLAPPPPQLPPTPQPRSLISPKRHRCISEPTNDGRHIEDCSPPASDNGAYISPGTVAAPQPRRPDVMRLSPEDSSIGKSDGVSSRTAEAASGVPPDAAATAPAVPAGPTAPMADCLAPMAVDRILTPQVGEVLVFCELQRVTFRAARFVAPPASTAEPKPDSVNECQLPVVKWHTDEAPPSNCDNGSLFSATPSKGNRCHTEPLIPPTLEEEEEQQAEEEENGGDYYSLNHCTVPLHPAPSRPSFFIRTSSDAAGYVQDDSSDYVDPVSISSARAGHLPATEAKEGANRQKDGAEMRPKGEGKKLREVLKRQKDEEKQRRAQEKAEKKEKERREKDEQKRAAELQKLLSLYKVSSADPPICEAIVNKDYLKPEKNELLVHAGERLFILAKDAKGRWLARSSSSGVGIVASSNLSLTETDTRGSEKNYAVDNSEGIYEELNR